MKKYILNFLSALLLLSGCDYNDKYFDGLDDLSAPTNKLALEYTLTDADYVTISTLSANKNMFPHGSDSIALAAIKTNKYLSDIVKTDATVKANSFVPAFLASKWYSASEGSAVKVTYKKSVGLPDYVTKLNTATNYTLSAADYKTVWGSNSSVNFFTPATTAASYLPGLLAAKYPNAVSGDVIAVNYNESANEPSGSVVAINEGFSAITAAVSVAAIEGWANVTTVGTYSWNGKIYNSNSYLQASANNHTAGPLEIYMISPSFNVTSGLVLTFEACLGYYKAAGGKLSVLVSSNLGGTTVSDINAATWDDISSNFSIPIPASGYGTLGNVGSASLSKYVGKKVYIAFRYNGDGTAAVGATTTVQIDNVVVKSEASGASADTYTATGALYTFNGTTWTAYGSSAYFLTKADFKTMGSNYDNFSSTMLPDNYLPQFLKLKYPYAQEGTVVAPTYKYYSTTTTIRADEYTYKAGIWVKSNSVKETTDQFVYTSGSWKYNPSVVITLKPGRSQPDVAKYYQAIADYVAATYGTGYYQTGFTNAEFYYGSSAYYNEIDFKTSWVTGCIQGQTAYGSLDDASLTALKYERLPGAFIPALEKLHADAVPVDGVDVTYTINFGIYTDATISACTHTIVYKVIGTGKFEYVANSLKAL